MIALLAIQIALAACPPADPAARAAEGPSRDAEAAALALAPVLFVEGARNPARRHWDLPMAVDFDGDLVGRNNAEAIRSGAWRDAVVPTVYWSVLETETHVFATYHLFHPLDWGQVPNTLDWRWHENDGENVQVVARKVGDHLVVELVAAQAHLRTTFAATEAASWGDGPARLVGGDAWTVDGRIAVYQERGGHGLHPAHRRARRFRTGPPDPTLTRGIRLHPAAPGEPVPPPSADDDRGSYRLVPTEEAFWQRYLSGGLRTLMDVGFTVCTELTGPLLLPRHYDSDMLSGPGKRDSGISPFAVGMRLYGRRARLGSLFFDPAGRYPAILAVPQPWSERYVRHPYAGIGGQGPGGASSR